MKKIQDYINKHPKLKRIVKILGVVAIVFSFLFNALIIGSLIINASKPKDSKVLAYGDYTPIINTPVKNMGVLGGYYYMNIAELSNETGYNDLLYLLRSDFASAGESFDNYYTTYNSLGATSYFENDVVGSYYLGDSIISNSMPYACYYNEQIYLLFYQHVSSNNWLCYSAVYSYFSTTYSYYVNSFEFYYTGSDITKVPLVAMRGGTDPLVNSTRAYNFSIKFSQYWSTTLQVVNGWYTLYSIIQNQPQETYEEGYNAGYSVGTEFGRKTGYNEGYIRGLDDASQGGIETNAFTLISQAFHSIASILNIQVLPHLTLGVLIFAPLIVTLIIVIVKMVRG